MKHEYRGGLSSSDATKAVELDKYSRYSIINNPYLHLKVIDGPMPEDYAKSVIKAKTLLNPAKHEIKIIITKRNQRMNVYRDLEHAYAFKVSTGKGGHNTPAGSFKPYSLESMHYSRKYHMSPMPWSVFFNGGVAIHGTESIHNLGNRASHGCVRTHPKSARRIYNLIRKYGKRYDIIHVTYHNYPFNISSKTSCLIIYYV
jgi:lipoprotein-anchoring transpeptidase ErfK/SrfK